MALKQLLKRQQLIAAQAAANAHRAKRAALDERRSSLAKREADATAALEELTAESTEDERKAVSDEVDAIDADTATLDGEVAAHDAEQARLDKVVTDLEADIAELDARSQTPGNPTNPTAPDNRGRKETHTMNNRTKFYNMTVEERSAFFAREEVRGFIDGIKAIKTRGITNGGLTIPDIVLEVLRDNMEKYSKLIKYVNVRRVGGTARQNIIGAVPEGVWMEAVGALNELDMAFNQIEVDGYMVGGIVWVPNTLLEDSDINLGAEVMAQLGQAIGKGLDRAMLFGTGTKMPVGIATRLAQTSAPSSWGTYAPAWTDLHTSNVKKINIDGTTGAAFYASLIAELGIAKPDYSDGKAFWAMNRRTHVKLMTKALAFDAAAALVAGVQGQMPIIGGDIVELEMLADNNIIGGYGSVYLLAERAGAKVESSEHAKFQQMLTGFRGYARYDGMPVFGEAFVQVSFANADATSSSTFPTDYANTDIGALAVTSAASATTSGDTVITVVGAENTGTTLAYKVAGKAATVNNGDVPKGFTDWDGDDEITAATGKIITVVELNSDGRAIKVGSCSVVAKA